MARWAQIRPPVPAVAAGERAPPTFVEDFYLEPPIEDAAQRGSAPPDGELADEWMADYLGQEVVNFHEGVADELVVPAWDERQRLRREVQTRRCCGSDHVHDAWILLLLMMTDPA